MHDSLDESDRRFLKAAVGWLELGNPAEAETELTRIDARKRNYPEVLQVSWQIHAQTKQWTQCLEIATLLTQLAPERRFGWIHRAHSLHQLGRTLEARDLLLSVEQRFAPNSTIPYYLACYHCHLGDLPQARLWWDMTLASIDNPEEKEKMILRAKEDRDLKALWKHLQ